MLNKENVLKHYTSAINGYIVSGIKVFLTGVATRKITMERSLHTLPSKLATSRIERAWTQNNNVQEHVKASDTIPINGIFHCYMLRFQRQLNTIYHLQFLVFLQYTLVRSYFLFKPL
jgi:hypothetical protein